MKLPAWGIAFLIVAVAGMTALFVQYQRKKRKEQGDKRPAVIALKGGATLVSVIVALVACVYGGGGAPAWLMVAGLVFCTAGDVLLCVHFYTGMGAFALGHVAYIAAFLSLHVPDGQNAALFVVLLLALFALLFRWRGHMAGRLIPFSLYGALLVGMLSLTVGLSPLLTAGAALFVVSDGVLAHDTLVGRTRLTDDICLTCYFYGQFLIAMSVFLL